MGASIVIRLCLPNYLTAAVRATLMDFLQKLVKKNLWEINEPKVGCPLLYVRLLVNCNRFLVTIDPFGDQITFNFLA